MNRKIDVNMRVNSHLIIWIFLTHKNYTESRLLQYWNIIQIIIITDNNFFFRIANTDNTTAWNRLSLIDGVWYE